MENAIPAEPISPPIHHHALETHIIPIEVKAGKDTRIRSMRRFMTEKNAPFGIRISQDPLSFEKGILSLPLYMIGELNRLDLLLT